MGLYEFNCHSEKEQIYLTNYADLIVSDSKNNIVGVRFGGYPESVMAIDCEGWELCNAAKEITKIDIYSYFPAEDNQGCFEELDGNGILKWIEIAAFAEIEWNYEQPPYEKYSRHKYYKDSHEYLEYQEKLYPLALKKVIELVERSNDKFIKANGYLNTISVTKSKEESLKKRFRDENGQLTINTKEIAELTLDEANAYYINGEQYKHQYKIYTCCRFLDKDSNGDMQEVIKFASADGYNLFVDPTNLGTWLPDVASEGMEITRLKINETKG